MIMFAKRTGLSTGLLQPLNNRGQMKSNFLSMSAKITQIDMVGRSIPVPIPYKTALFHIKKNKNKNKDKKQRKIENH